MAKKLRAGVIGCGAIAQNCHLPGYAKDKNCIIAAVADPARARLKEVNEAFKIEKSFSKWEKMLDEVDLDVVSVCTPNAFHAEQAIAAMNRGIHVLCEKPLCLSMAEAKKIRKAQEKSGVKFMVGFTHRFFTGNQKAKKLLDKGDLGKPFMIRIRFAHSGPVPGWAKSDWFYDAPRAGGGALLDMGIHAIDLAMHLIGPIKAVSASIGTLVKKIHVDDNAVLILEFENKQLGYIEVGWTSKPGFAGTEVYGTEGSLFVDYLQGLKVLRGKNTPDGKQKLIWRTLDKNPTRGGWDVEIGQFLDYVRKNKEPKESLQCGINALAVALASYRSAKTGRKVMVKDILK